MSKADRHRPNLFIGRPQPVRTRRFLFVPVMPTPNGGLHLGHIAGPFLRSDIAARALRLGGHECRTISGSDVYESYMLLKELQTERPATRLAEENDARIRADLAALDVGVDSWILPTDDAWRETHDADQRAVLDALRDGGRVSARREVLSRGVEDGRFITGCWLLGRCPDCGSDAGSYFCEACGGHFQPGDIVDAADRLGAPVMDCAVESLILPIDAPEPILRTIAAWNVPDRFADAAARSLARDPGVRLTVPGSWGVPYDRGGSDDPQTYERRVFSYAGLFAFGVTCGRVWQSMTGDGVHPFSPESDVVIVTSFGLDNCVPYLVAVPSIAVASGHRPYDYVLTNFFLELEGRKFSTSRNHLVWARDIVERAGADVDLVRLFLASISPEESEDDFGLDAFVSFYARKAGELNALCSAVARAGPVHSRCMPRSLCEALEVQLARHPAIVGLDGFRVRALVARLEAWLASGPTEAGDAEHSWWWLRGLALVAAPIMPRLARRLWAACGGVGDPTIARFAEPLVGDPDHLAHSYRALTRTELLSAVHLEKTS